MAVGHADRAKFKAIERALGRTYSSNARGYFTTFATGRSIGFVGASPPRRVAPRAMASANARLPASPELNLILAVGSAAARV